MQDIKNKIIEWLDKKWKKDKRHCEICGENQWEISQDIVSPLTLQNGNINVGGIIYPWILLICKNCGNTKCFNAVKMNVIMKNGEEDGN